MNIKRYKARDMREALRRIREDQGPDAVILSSRKTDEGLEVISAVDFDESLVEMAGGGRARREADDDRPADSGAREAVSEPPRETRRNGAGFLHRLGYAGKQGRKASGVSEGDPECPPEDSESPEPTPDRVSLSSTARAGVVAGEDTQPHTASAGREAQKPEDLAMRQEINALRRMLESQLSALSWHDFTRENPARTALLRDLIKLGLGRETSRKLAAEVTTRQDDLAYGWGQASSAAGWWRWSDPPARARPPRWPSSPHAMRCCMVRNASR